MRMFTSRWRVLRLFLVLLLSLALISSYVYLNSRPSYTLYHELNRLEVQLSQKWINEAPSQQRFVKFKQLQGAGFNNQAQEILLFHHLALLASRTYIYQPFIWRSRGEHAVVPLSAFLHGVTQNSVSDAVFEHVCPSNIITHVNLRGGVYSDPELWNHAIKVLSGPGKCIVVDDWILNWRYLASPAIHAIWPSFKQYLAKNFRWSNTALNIAHRSYSRLSLRSEPQNSDGSLYMALHFRRGDFEEHCHILARDRVGFTTWATLPSLHDSVFPPALDSSNETSTMEHCYPSLSRVLDVIDSYARARPHLRTLHILHDGAWDHPLVYYQQYRLETALKDPGRAWPGGPMKHITHSGMLPLKWGEADWAVAVDIELARNAEVFIGNGFSSLSSQVVALRLGADGGRSEDITFL